MKFFNRTLIVIISMPMSWMTTTFAATPPAKQALAYNPVIGYLHLEFFLIQYSYFW